MCYALRQKDVENTSSAYTLMKGNMTEHIVEGNTYCDRENQAVLWVTLSKLCPQSATIPASLPKEDDVFEK